MVDKIKKTVKDINFYLKRELEAELDSHNEEIRNIIIDDYHMLLSSAVTDRRSRTNPGLPRYEDAFKKELEEFDMLEIRSASIIVTPPSIDRIDWSTGTLKVIKTILEGTAGVYVEIDAEQYEKMYGTRPKGLQVFDDTARKKDMVYIIRYTPTVQNKEINAFGKKELVVYPFSNTPPIDIFETANKYVDDNIADWIDAATERALKHLKKEYRG